MNHDSKLSTAHKNPIKVSRRATFKKVALSSTLLAGVLIETKWRKPIIDSVISPAHAQATSLACPGSQTFSTPGEFQFVVPECATELMVEVRGAGGGSTVTATISLTSVNSPGGIGGFSSGTLSVTPGETLTLMVGGQGANGSDPSTAGGFGYGNGGEGINDTLNSAVRGAGGGGSAILRNNTPLIVAGGGGGAGQPRLSDNNIIGGGDGGGTAGEDGTNIDGPFSTNFGGRGGSNGIGGAATGENVAGGPLNGGNGFLMGGSSSDSDFTGGGGGGGFGGGGGGGLGSGGGGGGGLAGPNGTTETGGGNSGNGSITISW